MLADLQRDLMGHIGAAWPEIALPPGPRQFFTEIQAFRENFVEEGARKEVDPTRSDRLPPPYTVLQFGTERRDYAYGNIGAIRVPVTIFYIGKYLPETQTSLRERLECLRRLVDGDGPHYQAIEFGEIDTSADSPINAALLVGASTAYIAGHVRWEPGLLVLPCRT